MKIDNVGDKIVQGEMESKKEAEPVVFNGQDNELENQPWTKRKFMHFFLASFAGVGLAAFLLGSLLIYSSLPKIQPSMDPIEP